MKNSGKFSWEQQLESSQKASCGFSALSLCSPAADLVRARMYLLVAVVACFMRCDWVYRPDKAACYFICISPNGLDSCEIDVFFSTR